MKRDWALWVMFGLVISSCANGTQRYVQAVNLREKGDATAYYDELVDLASSEPGSRAGRRARATLLGYDFLTTAVVTKTLSEFALPNLTSMQARFRQSEAKNNLQQLHAAQLKSRDERGRFCKTFKECHFDPGPDAHYLYFLDSNNVVGGGGLADAADLRNRARALMRQMGLAPEVKKKSFVAIAAGNIDDDAQLDVWLISEANDLSNPVDDVDAASSGALSSAGIDSRSTN